jgi:hypothetical protein
MANEHTEMEPATGTIKFTLEKMEMLYGLKSITVLLDGQDYKQIQPGETITIEVAAGHHTLQTRLKSRPFLITLFFTVTRRSKILAVEVAANAQVSVTATYSRTWGNFELKL